MIKLIKDVSRARIPASAHPDIKLKTRKGNRYYFDLNGRYLMIEGKGFLFKYLFNNQTKLNFMYDRAENIARKEGFIR